MIAAAALAAGCAQAPARVSAEVFVCCEAEFERFETYQVSMIDVPGFLEPYLYGGLAPVLDQKGLRTTLDRPDLMVNIMFNQIYLTEDAEEKDPFGESVDPAAATRFMAAVTIDVIDTDSEHIVWSGRLSRIHHDPLGQPRGNDHKMQGIIDGFRELFEDYPIRLADTNAEM